MNEKKGELMRYGLLILLAFGLLPVFSPAQATRPSSANISGAWKVTIERLSGPVNDTLAFRQDTEKLTGTYNGTFFEHKFSGTVKDNKVTFTWDSALDPDGKGPPTVTFNGTIESANRMTGTVGIPFAPEGRICKWTATRK